jgi:hypothetical protein
MKNFKILPLLLAAALTVSAAGPPRVTRDSLAAGESILNDSLRKLWSDLGVIGTTRGVYLEGYGVVYTAEVTLVTASISMMQPSVSPEQMKQLGILKQKRIPELKNAMKQTLVTLANSLNTVGPDEQVSIGLLLLKYPGETKPATQVVLQGSKRKLLEAQGAAALDQVIRVTEY